MKDEPRWIPLQAVVDLHKRQIEDFGGLPGIQKQGSLDSALTRPRQIYTYGGEQVDLYALAAAYAWGIAKNHPFVDGNKRMSLVCVYVFLGLNGYYLDATEEDAYSVMMALASGRISEEQVAEWVRSHTFESNSS